MLNFFRKIRRGSLRENQVGKYLKYALGEILLVVLGILIALQVNNWNEDKQLAETQKIYLKEFSADVEKMYNNYHYSLPAYKEGVQSSIKAFQSFQNCEISEDQKVIIDQMLINYKNIGVLYQVRDTYEEMLSANLLANLEDKELKNAITAFFAQADAMMLYINEFKQELTLHVAIIEENVVYSFDSNNRPRVEYNPLELCQNKAFSNALYKHIIYNEHQMQMFRVLNENLEGLKKSLKNQNLDWFLNCLNRLNDQDQVFSTDQTAFI